jgi:hypothetical protein
MVRLLLGMLVGAAAAAVYMSRSSSMAASARALRRVDELSTAAANPVADPAVEAGDGTPGRSATTGV